MPLVLDTFCEVHDLLSPYAAAEFWNFAEHDIIPGAVYLIGRDQFENNLEKIVDLVKTDQIQVILSNPHEGSDTLRKKTMALGVAHLVQDGKILLIGGGDMDRTWPCLQFDSFLPKVLDYEENIAAADQSFKIFEMVDKPFKFLFLNGRRRSHRTFLLKRWANSGLLDQALWSNLDSAAGPTKTLPRIYEPDRYQHTRAGDVGYIKHELFDNEWGEIYIESKPYIDTYFSVVTETVHDYPYSFRTEKIWKPIVMGHPWLVSANRGFLRDMRDLGFRTFTGIIDESYDDIDDNHIRLTRLAKIIEDLVRQDLTSFLTEVEPICKYNQAHYAVMRERVRSEFPDRFFQFLKKNQWTI